MQQFEYKTIYVSWQPADENSLNEHGLEGWELVGVIGHVTSPLGYTYTFKRPLRPEPIQVRGGGYYIPPMTFSDSERELIIETLKRGIVHDERL